MTKYIIGEIFSSGEATLYTNPSDHTVYIQIIVLGLPDGSCQNNDSKEIETREEMKETIFP